MAEQRDPRTYAIIGAAQEVHAQLGNGFLESVYHEALVFEFIDRKIPFEHELDLPVFYRGNRLTTIFRADFVCFGEVIVEAIKATGEVEKVQILNYLKATGLQVGLLLNFGSPSLESTRFIRSPKK